MSEVTDPGVRPKSVLLMALCLLGALLAAVALAWLGWSHWRPNGPNAPPAIAMHGPVLETSPQPNELAFKGRQKQAREQWGWVPGEPGVARIPLEQAKVLLIARDTAAREKERK